MAHTMRQLARQRYRAKQAGDGERERIVRDGVKELIAELDLDR
jgi:hypothetical protein